MAREKMQKFTLEEANALLPELIGLTRQTVEDLESTRARRALDPASHGQEAEDRFQEEVSRILANWAESVMALGIYPKGYFTCDFVSPNPDTYFCWTYGEETIGHTHKVYETFQERVPIESPGLQGFDFSLN